MSRPFNGDLESALRTLFVLGANPRRALNTQRLMFYDYILVHSSDLGGPPSIHPQGHSQAGELLVRRKLMRDGLELLRSRDLAERRFASTGIKYAITDVGVYVAGHFESVYSSRLVEVSAWIESEFAHISDATLRKQMAQHIGEWEDELIREPTTPELPW